MATLDSTKASQSKRQAIGMWKTHWLMTRIEKANFRTICNKILRSTIALTEERLEMSLAPRFLNGDVAQKVDRTLSLQEVRRPMPRISNFSEEPGNQKNQL